MGATNFYCRIDRSETRTLKDQFAYLRAEAQDHARMEAEQDGESYEGYSGTIAEKHDFRVIACHEGKTARETVDALEHAAFREGDTSKDNPYTDKFGPAGCVFDENDVIFFGLASC